MSNKIISRPRLSLDLAKEIVAAAEAKAKAGSLSNLAIVVVDEGGYLVYGLRMDNCLPPSSDIAIAKARAAAMLGKPTRFWREQLNGGNFWPLSMPFVVSAEGGMPLIANGTVLGGIGIAGATGPEDREIGEAGVAVLTAVAG
jgi:uncharacterized protein GlcG (DUF336 family)